MDYPTRFIIFFEKEDIITDAESGIETPPLLRVVPKTKQVHC